jgi:hypothetical protein
MNKNTYQQKQAKRKVQKYISTKNKQKEKKRTKITYQQKQAKRNEQKYISQKQAKRKV